MKVKNETTIEFVSDKDFYDKEESGRKNNTIRWLSEVEKQTLKRISPTQIIIRNRYTHKQFTRQISDISEYGGWTIFTWVQ